MKGKEQATKLTEEKKQYSKPTVQAIEMNLTALSPSPSPGWIDC